MVLATPTTEATMPVASVVFREDLYPRIKPDPALIQRYAENIDVLPPIEVNQHGILIDGFHRWTAHRKMEAAVIRATVTETVSEQQVYALAIRRNAAHGWQMDEGSKRQAAVRLYGAGTGLSKDDIATTLSVSLRSVNGYLSDIDRDLRERRKQRIFELHLAAWTDAEISSDVGVSEREVGRVLPDILEGLPNSQKAAASYTEADWQPPVVNVWTYAKKSNEVGHFGNSEQRILDNLLYLYTDPFDIVLDPFAGGGATIDVCRRRLRRYWVSDRKPIVEREKDIRRLDIVADVPPLHRRWSEVALTYLDPPYWKQAEGQYSTDAEDLANMPLDQFTTSLAGVVNRIAEKQSKGVIALLMQPTQWKSERREFTDHVTDLVRSVSTKRLQLENRVSCPYNSEQYNAQQVEWAKANKKLLVLTRELLIWRLR
jgi:hypothetical protein